MELEKVCINKVILQIVELDVRKSWIIKLNKQ